MESFRARGFVAADSLGFTPATKELWFAGEISCLGGIVISVEKTLVVIKGEGEGEDALVQTVGYAYNASVRGNDNFLRHDNAPHGGRAEHHRHEFDWRTGQEIVPVKWYLDADWIWPEPGDWPTLGDFIDEVEVWYWQHRPELPDPEGFGTLGARPR